MKAFILAALLLTGCPKYEGDRVNVAGIELEGMAWPIDCATTTPATLYHRWVDKSPNYCTEELRPGEGYDMCPDWYVVRYRYEWAKAELRQRCAQ